MVGVEAAGCLTESELDVGRSCVCASNLGADLVGRSGSDEVKRSGGDEVKRSGKEPGKADPTKIPCEIQSIGPKVKGWTCHWVKVKQLALKGVEGMMSSSGVRERGGENAVQA